MTRHLYIPAVLSLAMLAACTQKQNPEDLKEKTAQATAEAKQDAKAVAAGIREGWNRNTSLDLNTASKQQLAGLPGMTNEEADRVIAGRPYETPGDLVTRNIVSKSQYDQISSHVTVKK